MACAQPVQKLAATPEMLNITRRSQKKLCFGLWLGLVLVLPKLLAVTIKNNFMVYIQNYFNWSTLVTPGR
jgi:hypothetical protein